MIYEPQTLLEHIFIFSDYPVNLERGSYVWPLVVLSYIIAVVGSYVSLSLLNGFWFANTPRQQSFIHALSALSLGVGIWSMHFVGMLAYDMDMVHTYDVNMTLISMVIAAIVAYGFIYIVRNFKQTILTYILSSTLLGIAICSMHYTGMAAMIMDADIVYQPYKFMASLAIAITASAVAIWIIYHLKTYGGPYKIRWQIVAAMVMGAAICGMHYMGMEATVFLPYANCRFNPDQTYFIFSTVVVLISGTIFIGSVAFDIIQNEKRAPNKKQNIWNVIPIMIAVFGLLITIFITIAIHNYYSLQNQKHMDVLVAEAQDTLKKRYEMYLQTLRGGVGFFKGSDSVSRSEWKAFVDAQNIDETLIGINGIGFIEYVKKENLNTFLGKARADEHADFINHPQTDFDDKFVIKYIEPVSRNLKAVGLDIGFEKNRRQAAEYSIKTTKEALTKKIELVQDNKKRAGFLLLLPFYERDVEFEDAEARMELIEGWVYAPFIGEYFLQNLSPRELSYAVYDETEALDENLIYKTPNFSDETFVNNTFTDTLSRKTSLTVAGRPWTILWHGTSQFELIENKNLAIINFLIGLIITSLITGMTYSLSHRTKIVQELVDEKTKDLQAAEEKITEAHAFLEGVLDHVPDPVFVKNRRLEWIDGNTAFWEVVNLSKEECVGKTDYDFFSKEEADIFRARDEHVFATKALDVNEEAITVKGGEQRIISTKKAIFTNDNGEDVLIGTIRDITDIREANRQLEEVNSELEEFAYRTSHDLRSPIISSASLLELADVMIDNDNISDAKKSLAHARRSLGQLKQLIDDILQLTVIRNKDEEQVSFSVKGVVNDALEKLSHMSGFDRIDVQTSFKFRDSITSKKLRFVVIVENLISNAIKYQDLEKTDSFIKILTYEDDGYFVFEVKDNGIGIPEDQRDELFMMFKRFHPKVAYGSGLGLYLLKKSADILGANIVCENLGDGTAFKIKINQEKI